MTGAAIGAKDATGVVLRHRAVVVAALALVLGANTGGAGDRARAGTAGALRAEDAARAMRHRAAVDFARAAALGAGFLRRRGGDNRRRSGSGAGSAAEYWWGLGHDADGDAAVVAKIAIRGQWRSAG